MLDREQTNSLRNATNPFGLIIPIIIDDGECFPPEVRAIKGEALHEFANPFIRIDSPKQEALAEVLRTRVCPGIENSMRWVPDFDPNWEKMAHKHFEAMFQLQVKPQRTVPSLKLPQIP
jgi:hypothetical protein